MSTTMQKSKEKGKKWRFVTRTKIKRKEKYDHKLVCNFSLMFHIYRCLTKLISKWKNEMVHFKYNNAMFHKKSFQKKQYNGSFQVKQCDGSTNLRVPFCNIILVYASNILEKIIQWTWFHSNYHGTKTWLSLYHGFINFNFYLSYNILIDR